MNLVPAPIWGLDAREAVVAGVRPHDVVIGDRGDVQAVVELVEPRGHDAVVHLRLDAAGAPTLLAVVTGEPPAIGSRVRVAAPADRIHLFDAASGARLG
jgi:ABC-type sugar transport system ATPase subunit